MRKSWERLHHYRRRPKESSASHSFDDLRNDSRFTTKRKNKADCNSMIPRIVRRCRLLDCMPRLSTINGCIKEINNLHLPISAADLPKCFTGVSTFHRRRTQIQVIFPSNFVFYFRFSRDSGSSQQLICQRQNKSAIFIAKQYTHTHTLVPTKPNAIAHTARARESVLFHPVKWMCIFEMRAVTDNETGWAVLVIRKSFTRNVQLHLRKWNVNTIEKRNEGTISPLSVLRCAVHAVQITCTFPFGSIWE